MTNQPTTVPSDAWLVERCLAHDEAAWHLLLDQYGHYIYAIAARGFRLSPEEAEEVFQETVLSVFQNLSSFRGSGSLLAWIGRITQNVCRQHLRRRGRHSETPLDLEQPDAGQETALREVETAFVVQNALKQLSPECRDILTQFFYENRRYADIAASLEIAVGTVASRIARCLVRLRAVLGPEL